MRLATERTLTNGLGVEYRGCEGHNQAYFEHISEGTEAHCRQHRLRIRQALATVQLGLLFFEWSDIAALPHHCLKGCDLPSKSSRGLWQVDSGKCLRYVFSRLCSII